MKEKNKDISYLIKNKKLIYCFIVIITIYLYYKVRIVEDNLQNNKNITRNKKEQLENDIHLNNSKLLNIQINKENIKNLILSEKEKEENDNRIKNEELKFELWKVETFFVTLFFIIFGGLYYYSNKQLEKNNEPETNYISNDYTKYFLDESEFEYLINNSK